MNNYIKSGMCIPVTAPRDVTSGEGLLVGSIFGIVTRTVSSGATVELCTCGVYAIAKTSTEVWAAGDFIYWDDTNKIATNAPLGRFIGVAIAAATNPTATGQVLIDGGFAWDERAIRYTTVALTNAEIKALRAAPKTLVAAPGAGKYLEFVGATLFLDYGTSALTESTANLAVKYVDGSGTQVSQTIEATGFIDQTADTATNAQPKIDAIAAKSACENKALVLHNLGAGEFGGNAGNDTVMRVSLAYRVHSTGW